MAIKKTGGGWQVDIQPAGRGGKRFRKTVTTRRDAQQWETWVKAQVQQAADWQPDKKDARRLRELIDLWYRYHGINLKSHKDTYSRLCAMAEAMGNPLASTFGSQRFAEYRERRLSGGVSANTLNREHSYLKAVFGELKRLGYWKSDNPLTSIRRYRIQEKELSYLTTPQIEHLFEELQKSKNADVLLATKIALATGARWSEAQFLRREQLQGEAVTFTNTKAGKNRTVPIASRLAEELRAHKESGRLFGPCYGAFREAMQRTKIELPEGQMAHVLRHTFASHFIMNGGNILTLQRILGHYSITVTMRYAHLAPDHLEEAKKMNPLAVLTLS
ncbi:phage integrase [Methylogaea oryzae]|uniref:Integrase n=1 Tax=Methylogaea oryzae TaxID=1295382 RepID=A0A8D4VS13_9GAMM|nr:tyrosine-type recombinase/integrase [Methylogaea oryzae]BBL72801.1 integrase [Methylogaea oryzae]